MRELPLLLQIVTIAIVMTWRIDERHDPRYGFTSVAAALPAQSTSTAALSHSMSSSTATQQDDAALEVKVMLLDLEFVGPIKSAESLTIFRQQQAPHVLHVREPRARWIALDIRECHLFRGDRIEFRGNRDNRTVVFTSANESDSCSSSQVSSSRSAFGHHVLVFEGDVVTVTYIASLATLALPLPSQATAQPVIVVDAFAFVSRSPRPLPSRTTRNRNYDDSSDSDDDSVVSGLPTRAESIVGGASELCDAVCYKKRKSLMYKKARAVVRLRIDPETCNTTATNSETSSLRSHSREAVYCTDWLVGRGNHVLTNYHCIDRLPNQRDFRPKRLRASSASDSKATLPPPSDDLNHSECELESVVAGFMVETQQCTRTDVSAIGEHLGTIEATHARDVAANAALDYALLRLQPNATRVGLARKYGYLTLRAAGPTDGEVVYIPQHPRGEAKQIASTMHGCPTVIRVLSDPLLSSASDDWPSGGDLSSGGSMVSPLNPNVLYNADTCPGSSGSPILSQRDHTVVALHHVGGTASSTFEPTHTMRGDDRSSAAEDDDDEVTDYNAGIRIDLVVEDLRRKRALPPCALAQTCARGSTDLCCNTKW